MVVQRTLNKIEELKERPHHERKTIALYWAIGVAVLLLLLWGYFAVRSIGETAIALTNEQNQPPAISQTASAAGANAGPIQGAETVLVASSTNGHVDLVPASEVTQ